MLLHSLLILSRILVQSKNIMTAGHIIVIFSCENVLWNTSFYGMSKQKKGTEGRDGAVAEYLLACVKQRLVSGIGKKGMEGRGKKRERREKRAVRREETGREGRSRRGKGKEEEKKEHS